MNPKIKLFKESQFIGYKSSITIKNNTSAEIWQHFMPLKKHITDVSNENLYSIQIYPDFLLTDKFTPETKFEKWACVMVERTESIPDSLSTLTIPSGQYAVFMHKGTMSDFPKTMDYIFREWLPNSNYQFDNRPQFEVMDHRYIQNSPDSEEEVWIPIKPKQ